MWVGVENRCYLCMLTCVWPSWISLEVDCQKFLSLWCLIVHQAAKFQDNRYWSLFLIKQFFRWFLGVAKYQHMCPQRGMDWTAPNLGRTQGPITNAYQVQKDLKYLTSLINESGWKPIVVKRRGQILQFWPL